ncbi:MAG: peptide chain release factor N(5)-glutamine methyltransferase [Puniceicoccales bacterium]|nr:peptide chain release factor N(5)-glutamine methyltransferase [Puniceicoccales bacterium]
MQTLGEIHKKTTGFFANKGVGNARLQSELLLAAALKCKRLDLYLQFERLLPEETLAQLRDWVRRRAAREPLQYITGETEFRDITLKCDVRALIPRPETEELVEHLLAELPSAPAGEPLGEQTSKPLGKSLPEQSDELPPATMDESMPAPPSKSPSTPPSEPVRVADLGTGTGAIALSVALERPDSRVWATDASTDALALARENAIRLGLTERVTFASGNWFDAFSADTPRFHAIAANPPYLTESELATAAPEVASHEPHTALVAQKDGLADLEIILGQARKYLLEGGFVLLETGLAHAAALSALAQNLGYARHESRKDLSGRDRFFLAWV